MTGLSRIEKMNSLDRWLMVRFKSHELSYTTILGHGDHNVSTGVNHPFGWSTMRPAT